MTVFARERHAESLVLIILLAVAAAACRPALDALFTFDETAGIAGNRAARTDSSLVSALAYRYSPDQARPLFFLSLLADARLFGTAPRPFRITNIVLHLICGLLIYVLLRRAVPGGPALAGAALFLLHPLQAESALYTWGRSGVLATLLALGALIAVPRPGGASRSWVVALSCLSLALLAKEEAVVLPLIAFVWWTVAEGWPRRAAARAAAILTLPIVLFGVARLFILGAAGRQVYARSLPENILGQAVVTLRMARLIVFPAGLSVDHAAVVPGLYPGLAALFVCLALMAAALHLSFAPGHPDRDRAARLAGAGVLIAATGCLIYWLVPLPDLMSERRAYLPMVGASIAVAAVADRLGAPRRRGAGDRRPPLPSPARLLLPAALLTALLAPLLWERARVWADPVRLWDEAARGAPGKARPLVNLGVLAAERGDLALAGDLFERAVAAEPRSPEALFNRARLRLDRGDARGAEADLEAAVAAGPRLTIAWINLGLARLRLGKMAAAEEALRAALEIDPGEPRALTNLGEVLRATGRVDEALALYRRALDSDPAYAYAAARLGVALEARGDRAGALAAYREALRRGPASPADRDAILDKVRLLESAAALPAPAPPVR